MKKFIRDLVVVCNQQVTKDYFVLHLKDSQILPEILPGQFVEVYIPNSKTTFLRRPFSIYDFDKDNNTLKLLIKLVGDGTQSLSELSKGDTVNVVFPLGNTFSLPKGSKSLLVGGGVGVAPMHILAKHLQSKGYEIDILIGGRSSSDIVEVDLYKKFGKVFITTDDGSLGLKGMVTNHEVLNEQIMNYSTIYACGPTPMMKAVASVALAKNIYCELSLENMMACGIGACLCCVTKTVDGNKTTCHDGPVFDASKLEY